MKSLAKHLAAPAGLFWQIHEKISSFTAHLIGPMVFNFGLREKPWNLRRADLLRYPEHSVGRTLGEFLAQHRLELIAGAESHDVYHVLFDYPTTFKGEVALQFFLRGNGKNSIASFSTALGAWLILPGQWRYLKAAKARGKACTDVSTLDLKNLLHENFHTLKASLFENTSSTQTAP